MAQAGVDIQPQLCLRSLCDLPHCWSAFHEEQVRTSIWTSSEDTALSARQAFGIRHPPGPRPSSGKAAEQARAGDARGSGLLQTWSLSSSPILDGFPTVMSFTSPVCVCRAPEAPGGRASQPWGRMGQDSRRTRVTLCRAAHGLSLRLRICLTGNDDSSCWAQPEQMGCCSDYSQ